MLERLLIAGSGGQGIVLIGRLFATAATEKMEHVTFFPAYGAEVRGGVSSCQVVLSSKEIASPVSETFDSMLIMNEESARRFGRQMRECPLVILNTPRAADSKAPSIIPVDATQMAHDLGDVRSANFVMLGKYLSAKPFITPEAVEAEMRRMLAGKQAPLLDLNMRALRLGLNHVHV